MDKIRRFSKLVYGNKYRHELHVLIARSESGLVYAGGLAQAVPGLKDNQAGQELSRLVEADLMSAEKKVPGQARDYYKRKSCAHWDNCERMDVELRKDEPSGPRLVEPDSEQGPDAAESGA